MFQQIMPLTSLTLVTPHDTNVLPEFRCVTATTLGSIVTDRGTIPVAVPGTWYPMTGTVITTDSTATDIYVGR